MKISPIFEVVEILDIERKIRRVWMVTNDACEAARELTELRANRPEKSFHVVECIRTIIDTEEEWKDGRI